MAFDSNLHKKGEGGKGGTKGVSCPQVSMGFWNYSDSLVFCQFSFY